jgi:4-diphosphocytidyl-2-C-methyl-D-erythritol kinase
MLARHVGTGAGVRLVIRKGIPVAGGMAGGSTEAAAALVACDALWGLGLERDTLLTLAGRLGSDVPFCLVGGTAMGTGRGEALTPVLGRGGFHWVFALAEDGLSTPAVFAERDRLTAGGAVPAPVVAPELMQALRSGDAIALGAALANDLQEAACSLRPALRETLAVGLDHGALGAVVSGSGPTVAFLVADVEAGLEVAVALSASQACHGVRRAQGPVPGARVVPTGSIQ